MTYNCAVDRVSRLAVAGSVVGIAAGLIGVGWDLRALFGLVLGAVGLPVADADRRERRVPDQLVGAGVAGVAAVALLAGALGTVDWASIGLGAGVTALPLLVVHLVSPAGMGFGDVKFAVVVGAALGGVAWRLGPVALVVAAVAAVVAALAVGRLRRSIPFAAFMAPAALLVLAFGG